MSNKEYTNKFRSYRQAAGIKTQAEAAKLLNCSESMLFKIERGLRMPGRGLSIRMAKLYKVGIEDIFLPDSHTNRVVSA